MNNNIYIKEEKVKTINALKENILKVLSVSISLAKRNNMKGILCDHHTIKTIFKNQNKIRSEFMLLSIKSEHIKILRKYAKNARNDIISKNGHGYNKNVKIFINEFYEMFNQCLFDDNKFNPNKKLSKIKKHEN